MLRTSAQTRALVTLFHSPASQASKNLVSLLKIKYANPAVRNFDIEITESKPTHEQFKTLNSFYSEQIDEKGAVRPILVDWFNGKIAINDESKSSQILEELAKQKN